MCEPIGWYEKAREYYKKLAEGKMFKVGDKVRCTEILPSDAKELRVGNIYTIVKTKPHFIPEDPWIYFSEISGEPFLGHHFRLSKEGKMCVGPNEPGDREMTKEEKNFAAAVAEIDVLPNSVLCGQGKEAIKKILGKALGVEEVKATKEITFILGGVYRTGRFVFVLSYGGNAYQLRAE